jgi:NAD(P)-dependent dehydrogenase (short-subunit alcohol dehydrogenase family)
MDLGIKNKIALVSGSTAGIGFAIALALAREGARVYVNGRTRERVEGAVEKIKRETGGDARGVALDLSTKAGAEEMLRAVPSVDILVNNLGVYEAKNFEELTDEDWERILNVNLMSGVRLARGYLPGMREKNHGRILFISSESGVQIPVEMIHYGVTKTAQVALARGLAESVAGTNITINSVLAGPTRSEGVEGFVKGLAEKRGVKEEQVEREFFQSVRPSSLLKRFATPEEVAALAVYLCGAPASATNGAAVRVDGGVVRSIL